MLAQEKKGQVADAGIHSSWILCDRAASIEQDEEAHTSSVLIGHLWMKGIPTTIIVPNLMVNIIFMAGQTGGLL